MKVSLIDVDSKIPNLALMRASTYHKQRGDDVKLGYDPLFDSPDLCYASKVFDFTPEPEYMPDCETLKGGPGYDLDAIMPFEDYDRIMPDYSLYGCDYAIGRFTRGCPNRCPWCVVPKMDGNEVRHVADLNDFWCGQEIVRLLDDNIMADADEFARDCEQLSGASVKVIWEALDIRLITDETAKALASVRQGAKRLHFAWDGHGQDSAIVPGIETLTRHGIKPWRLMFYVLVGFNTTPEYDMHRIMTLHELGANPFVMPFDKSQPYQRHLARWCNNKVIFKSTTFDDYEPWTKYRRECA
ncbi:MAG: hypothetical protein IIZ12_07500 [Eggerthellaceae bacterium]|nr:hypothetical protein [Eggerthellaceae bacterium]